jgi:hypothetical protein
MIQRHIDGEVMLGAYPYLLDGTCEWVAADFDDHHNNAFYEAKKLIDCLREYDIEPLCNTSQSGRGIHVRIIFDDPRGGQPVPVWLARNFMLEFIALSEVVPLNEGGAYDRIFPTQNSLGEDRRAIGNQIAMPLHSVAAKERGGCMLLDYQFNRIPLGDATWDAIDLYDPITRVDMADAAESLGKLDIFMDPSKKVKERREEYQRNHGDQEEDKEVTAEYFTYILDNCEFVNYAIQGHLSYDAWLVLATNLARFDEHGGRQVFHNLSSHDPRYSFEQTDQKYNQVLGRLTPITCSWLAANAWSCPELGADGKCKKFSNGWGNGPRAIAAIPYFVTLVESDAA